MLPGPSRSRSSRLEPNFSLSSEARKYPLQNGVKKTAKINNVFILTPNFSECEMKTKASYVNFVPVKLTYGKKCAQLKQIVAVFNKLQQPLLLERGFARLGRVKKL